MSLREMMKKKDACALCGDSPVPHVSTYITQSFNVVMSGLDYKLRHSRAYDGLIALIESLGRLLARWVVPIGAALGLIRYNTDIALARSLRSKVIWEEAAARGIRMEQIVLASVPTEAYRAYVHGAWHIFVSLPVPPGLSPTHMWIEDKYFLKKQLAQHNVPVPASLSVRTVRQARRAFKTLRAPLVVKPRLGSRGRHTTTEVRDEKSLIRALRAARALCMSVSIEEQLTGTLCRGTMIGGTLRGFFEAQTPRVVGDGVHTIAELIVEKNLRRPESVKEIQVTSEVEYFLARAGRSISSVLEPGEAAELTHRTGRFFGGETRELLTTVHPRLVQYLEKAARIVEIPIVGFDLIIENPEEDPDTQRWGIIEANGLPFIDLHYFPLHGQPSLTAKAVWDLWETQGASSL